MQNKDKSLMIWYQKHNMLGKPVVTIISRLNEDGTVNRGISICNSVDNFSKSIGKKIAMERLLHAEEIEKDDLPVNDNHTFETLKYVYFYDWKFKSQFHAKIEGYEKRIFYKEQN